MLNRRQMIFAAAATAASAALPAIAAAQPEVPSAHQILRSLDAAPRKKIRPENRVTIEQFKRRPELRRLAPSIDIQGINFGFDSAAIAPSQYHKVERIASALHSMANRRHGVRVLLEGHTDAVGSFAYNQRLSEARAYSLKRVLVTRFGVPPHMMETVGYGEEYLLVPTPHEDWRNRRVTLRRMDDFIR